MFSTFQDPNGILGIGDGQHRPGTSAALGLEAPRGAAWNAKRDDVSVVASGDRVAREVGGDMDAGDVHGIGFPGIVKQ